MIRAPKKVFLQDRQAEKTLNELIGDIYTHLSSTSKEVTTIKEKELLNLTSRIVSLETPIEPQSSLLMPVITASTGADEMTLFQVNAYILFSWKNVGAGKSYNLRYKKTVVDDWTIISIEEDTSLETRTYRAGKLDSGVEHQYQIQSKDGTGFSEWTTLATITTWVATLPATIQLTLPSSYYLDLRGHKNSDYIWHVSCDVATLHDGSTPWKTVTLQSWDVTCDISVAGPVAGGRDQAGAFSTDSWIHFYLIGKSSDGTERMIASASATAPTLPSGYDYYMRCSPGRVQSDGTIVSFVQFNDYIWGNGEILKDVGPVTPDTWESIANMNTFVPATAKLWGGFGGQSKACVRSGMGVRSGSGTQDIFYTWVMSTSSTAISGYDLENSFFFTLPFITPQYAEWTASQTITDSYGLRITFFVDDL